MTRTRITLPALALFMAATVSACGSDAGPTDASKDDFCAGQTSLVEDLAASAQEENPKPDEVATTIHDWADEVADIGTPEDMPEDARAGFEDTIEQARDIDAEDLEEENLDKLGEELEGDAKDNAQAFNDYVGENCDVMGDLDMPETPDTGSDDSLEPAE